MQLQDETDYFQLGYDSTTDYLIYQIERTNPSSWTQHPTTNQTGLYKFLSVEVAQHNKYLVQTRQTYDVSTYLGDIGGLASILFMIGQVLIKPYNSFGLQTFLLTRLFRLQPSSTHEQSPDFESGIKFKDSKLQSSES